MIRDTSLTYENMLPHMRHLDLIIFKGGDVVSGTIQKLQKKKLGKGNWSHVGIVIHPNYFPVKNGTSDKLYIWESTMSGDLGDGVNCIETGKPFFGVQLRELKSVVAAYNENEETAVAFCPLINHPFDKKRNESVPLYERRMDILDRKFDQIYAKYNLCKYDANCLSLLGALYPWLRPLRDCCMFGKSWLFCSELVATVYRDLEIINPKLLPKNVVPMDFLGYDQDGMRKCVKRPIMFKKDRGVWV